MSGKLVISYGHKGDRGRLIQKQAGVCLTTGQWQLRRNVEDMVASRHDWCEKPYKKDSDGVTTIVPLNRELTEAEGARYISDLQSELDNQGLELRVQAGHFLGWCAANVVAMVSGMPMVVDEGPTLREAKEALAGIAELKKRARTKKRRTSKGDLHGMSIGALNEELARTQTDKAARFKFSHWIRENASRKLILALAREAERRLENDDG